MRIWEEDRKANLSLWMTGNGGFVISGCYLPWDCVCISLKGVLTDKQHEAHFAPLH